jgi:hypothetical protein
VILIENTPPVVPMNCSIERKGRGGSLSVPAGTFMVGLLPTSRLGLPVCCRAWQRARTRPAQDAQRAHNTRYTPARPSSGQASANLKLWSSSGHAAELLAANGNSNGEWGSEERAREACCRAGVRQELNSGRTALEPFPHPSPLKSD